MLCLRSHFLPFFSHCRPLLKVPAKMAWYILLFIKRIAEKYGRIKYNDFMSAHYIQLASRSRTFDCTAAQNQIGYSPVVSLEVSFSFIYYC